MSYAMQSFLVIACIALITCLFWRLHLYPNYVSPLRHIPALQADWKFLLYQWLYTEPNPRQLDAWLARTSHEGLVRYFGIWRSPRIIPLSPAAVREVLVTKVYSGDFERSPLNRARFGALFGNGIFVLEGDVHREQKKNMLPAFAPRNVRQLHQTFWAKAVEFAESVRVAVPEHSEAVLELSHYLHSAALDVIGVAIYGRDFDAIKRPDSEFCTRYRAMFRGTPRAQRQANLIYAAALVLPMATLRRWFPCEYFRNLAAGKQAVAQTAKQAIAEKRADAASGANERPKADILSHVMTGKVVDDDLLAAHMTNLLAAGHETSSLAVTWTCYLLCRHPGVQTRLRREIRQLAPKLTSWETLSDAELDLSETLNSLAFLKAVVRESLRVMPPAPIVRREAMRDTSVAGYMVPAGTGVSVSVWHINKNRYEWGEDAQAFKPDRWITDCDGSVSIKTAEEIVTSGSTFAYCPFTAGPRSCIGEGFALAEVTAMLAALIGRFELALFDDSLSEPAVVWGITTKPIDLKFRVNLAF